MKGIHTPFSFDQLFQCSSVLFKPLDEAGTFSVTVRDDMTICCFGSAEWNENDGGSADNKRNGDLI